MNMQASLGSTAGQTIPAAAVSDEDPTPTIPVEGNAPVQVLNPEELRRLGQDYAQKFTQYRSDRRLSELKWVRNLRQYLGIYDPEVDTQMSANRSRAYPKLTRAKCLSTLSRIMNLMFPGNEKNWSIEASPHPEMNPGDIMLAIRQIVAEDQQAGVQRPVDDALVEEAAKRLADDRARQLTTLVDDQLQEIGGDQTVDYIQLNRKALASGILFGLGVLRGPFVRKVQKTSWVMAPNGVPMPVIQDVYKPQLEFLPIWDFYPDMSAKTLQSGDGYFMRLVMSRNQVRDLQKRPDFFSDVIKKYLKDHRTGNYKPVEFETELRAMGTKANVNEMAPDGTKYEIVVWNGYVSAQKLADCGVDVKVDDADDIQAEIWMIDNVVIKAAMNPWAQLGVDVKTIHTFVFDEDDTAPVGNGLPNVMRDSQMSICAAVRMILDNSSIVCGPNVEINMDLVERGQDVTSIQPYKIWYRSGTGPEAQFPAVRPVAFDSHIDELLKLVELFLKFVDMETFVNPMTGGDMEKTPSEPMRTAAGASMLKGDAALPFKDIIRNFDTFTQSVINALILFNRKFNPDQAPVGDYNVIARGATSLIQKEIRGIQLDNLAQTLQPAEAIHVDHRKMVEARFAVRDAIDMLVTPEEAARRQAQQDQQMAQQTQMQDQLAQANVRKLLADAYKNITQGGKNTAAADANQVETALQLLMQGLQAQGTGQEQGDEDAGTAARGDGKTREDAPRSPRNP